MVRWLVLAAVVVAGAAAIAALSLSSDSEAAEPRSPGQFVVECTYSHSAPDDPIVHPGDPGASHLHDFFGNVAVDAFTTAEDLTRTDTTCQQKLDRASYWAPAVYLDGERVLPTSSDAYYRPAPGIDPRSIEPYPEGLMIVSGDEHSTFSCGRSLKAGQEPRPCAEGSTLAIHVVFPPCWDGRSVDSPDHRSHMAFPEVGRCPDSHPVAVPELEFVVTYPIDGDMAGLMLASGAPQTAHADFFNGWDPDKLANEVEACLHRELVCAVSDEPS